MDLDPNAGKLLDPADRLTVPRLVAAYCELKPDPSAPEQRVAA